MLEPYEPPERIAHLVDSGPDHVTFRSAKKPVVLIALGGGLGVSLAWLGVALIGAMAAFVGTLETFLFQVPGNLLFFSIFAGALGAGLGALLTSRARPLTVTPGEMQYGGILPPAADRPMRLVLGGEPGRPMRLESDNRVLAKFFPSPSQRGWDFDSVTWLGERVSELLGVKIRDERPEAEWRRWASDPLYRAQKQFDARLQDNRAEFHDHHATEPFAPTHRTEMDGMKIAIDTGLFTSTVLRITPTHLVLEGRKYRLDAITRAGVAYRVVKTKNSRTYYGRVQILVDGRVKTVLNLRVERNGGKRAGILNWIAETILEHARNARDLGTEADIPDDLARMVRPVPEGG